MGSRQKRTPLEPFRYVLTKSGAAKDVVVDITAWTWRRVFEDFDNCETYFLSGLTDQDVAGGVLWDGPCAEVFHIYESPVFSLQNHRSTNLWGVTLYLCPPIAEEECSDTPGERYGSLEEAKKVAEDLLAMAKDTDIRKPL